MGIDWGGGGEQLAARSRLHSLGQRELKLRLRGAQLLKVGAQQHEGLQWRGTDDVGCRRAVRVEQRELPKLAALLDPADDAHLTVALNGRLARAAPHDVEGAPRLPLLNHNGAFVVVLDAKPRDDVLHHLRVGKRHVTFREADGRRARECRWDGSSAPPLTSSA